MAGTKLRKYPEAVEKMGEQKDLDFNGMHVMGRQNDMAVVVV